MIRKMKRPRKDGSIAVHFEAWISINGRKNYIGSFKTRAEAVKAKAKREGKSKGPRIDPADTPQNNALRIAW